MKKVGITLLAFTLAVFLAGPVAAEFDPYGSVRVGTFWQNVDPNMPGVDDDDDLVMPLGDFSNFGATFKTGDLGGHVQLALEGREDHNAVEVELLYGTYDFGGGTLLVGQDHTPYTLVSAQVAPGMTYDLENRFIGYGALWDGYQPQIELMLESGLYLALIEHNTVNRGLGEDVDTTLPKVVVGYDFKTEGLHLNVGGAYNTYDIENATMDETIDAYLVYLNGKIAMGMADLQGSVHYGQNLGDFGLVDREGAATAQIDANGDVDDSDCWGGYLQVAFNVDPATITLGYGYVQSENDTLGDEEDEQQSYFANAKIPIADTFYVVPEISFYDQMEDANENDEAEIWSAGILWRMDF